MCVRVRVRVLVHVRVVTDIWDELGWCNGVCLWLRGMILAVKLWDCVPDADGSRVCRMCDHVNMPVERVGVDFNNLGFGRR